MFLTEHLQMTASVYYRKVKIQRIEKYLFLFTAQHPHEKLLNNEKKLQWGMFTLWFWISWWKVNICLDKRKHCITKYYHFVFDEKNIAVHNIEFDSAFDFFHMSYTLKIHADFLRCCSLLVSRGKQMNLDRELSTYKGLTFGNSIKTQINSKMNTLKIGL